MFLWAVPAAGIGFLLALFLKEVPLRGAEAAAVDLGEGFAMPNTESPDKLLEIAIGRLLRGGRRMRLRDLCQQVDRVA